MWNRKGNAVTTITAIRKGATICAHALSPEKPRKQSTRKFPISENIALCIAVFDGYVPKAKSFPPCHLAFWLH